MREVHIEMSRSERCQQKALAVLVRRVVKEVEGGAVVDGPEPGAISLEGLRGWSPIQRLTEALTPDEDRCDEALSALGIDWEAAAYYAGLPVWAWPTWRALHAACWSGWEIPPPLPPAPTPPPGAGQIDLLGGGGQPRGMAKYQRELDAWKTLRDDWRSAISDLEDWWEDPPMRLAREALRKALGMGEDPFPAALADWKAAAAGEGG